MVSRRRRTSDTGQRRRQRWVHGLVVLLLAGLLAVPRLAMAGDFWDEVREPGQGAYRAHVRRAETALATRRTEVALEATQYAIDALPNRPEAHALRAIALAESGDPAGMVREAERALELDTGAYDDPTWGGRVALLLAQGGAHPLALRVLRRTVAAMPSTHVRRQLYTLLGDVALALGPEHLDEATRAYRVALKSGPADSRTILGLGLALHRRGQRAEAEILLRRAAAPGGLEPIIASLPVPDAERAARTAVVAEVMGDAALALRAFVEAAAEPHWATWAAGERARLEGRGRPDTATTRPRPRRPR